MGWEDVVDTQDTVLRFWMSKLGQVYGATYGNSMMRQLLADQAVIKRAEAEGWDPREASRDLHWLSRLDDLEASKLMMAEPVYVNHEVKQVIDAAWPQYNLEPLRAEDIFPTLYGFMVFPEPFYVTDSYGKGLAFRALAWMPLDKKDMPPQRLRNLTPADTGGIFLTAYSHRDDQDDYPLTEEQLGGQRLPLMHLCHVSPWHLGQDPPIDVNSSGLVDMLRVTQVAWRIAKQTLTTPENRTLPKAFRKRAVRAGLPSDVTLIRLRHQKSKANEEPAQIDWQHRWIVRGHWHTYNYKDGTTRQLWVGDYVKGPEDKPLLVKPIRAFEFVR